MLREKRYVPDSEIENKANALLNGFQSQYGIINSPPIPIDQIIEHYLDLWLDWDTINDRDDAKILGLLNHNTKKITLNEKHRDHFEEYIGTEAFTKAHEVGHWDLHVVKIGEPVQLPLLGDIYSEPYLCRQEKLDKREFQAERYASYLLMPHDLLLEKIMGVDLTKWHNLYSLKDAFGVTITAFTKRLKGLGKIFINDNKQIFLSKEEAHGEKMPF